MTTQVQQSGTDPKFPATIRIACGIWLLLGGVLLVWSSIDLWQVMQPTTDLGARVGPYMAMPLVMLVLMSLPFLVAGVATLWGKVTDTRSNGLASIGLGILGGVAAVGVRAMVVPDTTRMVYCLVACVSLALAGVLALAGRGQYQSWKTWKASQGKDRTT
jgi:hypothetical protein